MQIDNVQVSKKISKQEKLELHSTFLLVSQYAKQGGHWCWVVIKTDNHLLSNKYNHGFQKN
jgi:hypothetical protein